MSKAHASNVAWDALQQALREDSQATWRIPAAVRRSVSL